MGEENHEAGARRYAPKLTERDEREAERRIAPNAAVIHEAIRREGESELHRTPSALAWSGLAAGLSMGFSLLTEGFLRVYLPNAVWSPLIWRFGYAVGFLIVILGRQQLFTENTVTPILPLLSRRDLSSLLHVLRLWAVVLATNLVGALAFAWLLSLTSLFDATVRGSFTEIAREAYLYGFVGAMIRGVLAGWLIALMVWLLPIAENGRVTVIIIMTYVIGIAGLNHVIAGSVDALYIVLAGSAAWSDYFGTFMLPTLIGNIIGGVALVSILNYAQVVAGSDKHLV